MPVLSYKEYYLMYEWHCVVKAKDKDNDILARLINIEVLSLIVALYVAYALVNVNS